MVGTDEAGIGGSSEVPAEQGSSKVLGNRGPSKVIRKTKATAARGPPPKRNTTDDGTVNPETSKVAQKKWRREKKDDTEVSIFL